jgi:hypothetical protein
METFACGYCGTQQMVRREGGTVSLKIIGEAIAGMKASTDRVAGELELLRLRDDVEEIDREVQKLDKEIGEVKTDKGSCLGRVSLGLISVLAAQIGRVLFHCEWLAAFIVALVFMYLCIILYEWWKINELERSKAEKVQQREALKREISNRIANLR